MFLLFVCLCSSCCPLRMIVRTSNQNEGKDDVRCYGLSADMAHLSVPMSNTLFFFFAFVTSLLALLCGLSLTVECGRVFFSFLFCFLLYCTVVSESAAAVLLATLIIGKNLYVSDGMCNASAIRTSSLAPLFPIAIKMILFLLCSKSPFPFSFFFSFVAVCRSKLMFLFLLYLYVCASCRGW